MGGDYKMTPKRCNEDLERIADMMASGMDNLEILRIMTGLSQTNWVALVRHLITTSPVDHYEKLHDGLSDMIEGGRLTKADIPDDYDWLVEMLAEVKRGSDS